MSNDQPTELPTEYQPPAEPQSTENGVTNLLFDMGGETEAQAEVSNEIQETPESPEAVESNTDLLGSLI